MMGKSDGREALGKNVAAIRLLRGMTQAELAQKAGCSEGFVSRIERGKTGISVLMLFRLCCALECRASELLCDIE